MALPASTRRRTAADPLDDPAFAERYRAMLARDARFDGRFVTGVHSTGIYCRPSCPAAAPKPGNVSFYLTAAAAHEAGLRACKRCLPDAVPGSPEWDERDDLAARAMRLIADGVVEREGVPGLASRLGYTTRHLTRVLTAELGAGPLALARAHRAQTARNLLIGTDLPAADIAFASGFGSVRQFNETVRVVYERQPGEIRAAARRRNGAAEAGEAGTVRLRLPAREPFDADGVFAWLAAREVAGVERATAARFERALLLPGGPARIRVAPDDDSPGIRIEARTTTLADVSPLVARVRRLFDLDADAWAIDAALTADPALGDSVRRTPGLRMPGCLDPHELLFRALIGQQVSVASARTALIRLADALGEALPAGLAGDGIERLFPTAEAIRDGGAEVLRGPASRIRTILDVAGRLADGSLLVTAERPRDELAADLLAVPGIGPWTAGYVSMRVTRDPDVLLVSDLALRSGARALGLPDAPQELAELGRRWAPWRSYASMHLWRAAA
ncbi:AlkA N-terminal domain-containing protein [Agromyces archimandritae]|uniref:DNA-3-methyladenine glycosylase II n=1 Tax=Agromyces archimandritae TaxID=2781962 RepID=A0A975INY1_9MICO|nr:AlkA N-terminal domain-containing protein [Agromyces archimandritae]QTX05078.1 DNA-3-methyladenine glycosylase 2 family protein [Agromyces archimandritae]